MLTIPDLDLGNAMTIADMADGVSGTVDGKESDEN